MASEQKIIESREELGMSAISSQEEEFDYVAGFFTALEMITDNTQPIVIARPDKKTGKSKKLLEFSVHALKTTDARIAEKKASTMMNNPVNKKLPKVVKEFNKTAYQSWLIYFATTDSDRQKYWDNPQFKDKCNAMEGYQVIDEVLLPGEKQRVLDEIDALSGYAYSDVDNIDEDEGTDEELAKN